MNPFDVLKAVLSDPFFDLILSRRFVRSAWGDGSPNRPHEVFLAPVGRGRYLARFQVDTFGPFRDPEHAVARVLHRKGLRGQIVFRHVGSRAGTMLDIERAAGHSTRERRSGMQKRPWKGFPDTMAAE
jgi:hypothetical protein